jgi:uncharacterized membrane protein YkoI
MMKRLRPALLALAAGLAFASPAFAHGDRGRSGDHDDALRAVETRQALPLTRIMSIAQEAVPGEIVEIELDNQNDRLIYEVKILARNGRVREVEIDARTGAVLQVEGEN